MSWRRHFAALADHIDGRRSKHEVFTASLAAEDSDFIRFNRGKTRQAGSVRQASIDLRWVVDGRHAKSSLVLTGDLTADCARLDAEIEVLRQMVPLLPVDPHLLLSTDPTTSVRVDEAPDTVVGDVLRQVVDEAGGEKPVDLVGIYAGGDIHRAFASSYGHRHWLTSRNVQLDWCLVHGGDKAVKNTWSGATWDPDAFSGRMASARRQLAILARAPRKVEPGGYRAFLTPAAVSEITDLLGWGDFGARSIQNRSSVFTKLAAGEARLDPRVRISEHTTGGIAPAFQDDGFVRPDEVVLVDEGRHVGALVSPRSAQEYGLETNGASGSESPESLAMAGGELPSEEALAALGTGVWVSNLWYLNHSDRNAARVTGMTRFATFWVENGEVVAPLSVMRFDESMYELFGSKLEAITREVSMIPSTSTYGCRSISSARLPGVLVEGLTFTL